MEAEEDTNRMVVPNYICVLMLIDDSIRCLVFDGSGSSLTMYQGGIIIGSEINDGIIIIADEMNEFILACAGDLRPSSIASRD